MTLQAQQNHSRYEHSLKIRDWGVTELCPESFIEGSKLNFYGFRHEVIAQAKINAFRAFYFRNFRKYVFRRRRRGCLRAAELGLLEVGKFASRLISHLKKST